MDFVGRGARVRVGPEWAVRTAAAGIALVAAAAGLCSCARRQETAKALQAVAEMNETEEAYRKVDPELVTYRQEREIDTGLRDPRGIALSSDATLYVAGDQAIRVFGRDGALQQEIALSDTPHCVAADDASTIFVGYRGHVRAHDASGAVTAEWAVDGEHPYVTCVTLSGDDVWVANAGDRVVLRYSRSGQLMGRLGERDDSRGVPGLVIPSWHLDVAVGPDKLLLVNNPGRLALETYTADGDMRGTFEKASMEIDGFCGCCNPTDIAVLPDGRVVTAEKGMPRIKILNRDGTLSCVVATPDDLSRTASGLDLAVGADGRVLVLDPPARLVRVFAEKQQTNAREVTP